MRAPPILLALMMPVAGASCSSSSPAGPGQEADAGVQGDGRTPGATDAGQASVPPEIDGQLVINEFMATNALTIKDASGAASDWIEIYNPTDVDVPLAGYLVTDDLAQVNKATIGDVIAPAGGYLILWADQRPDLGPDHINLRLSSQPEQLGLARPDGSFIDRLDYGAQAMDFSAAREPDGSDHWVIEWHASPGAANPAGPGTPAPIDDPNAQPEAVPEAGDLSEELLGYDRMPSFELMVMPDAMASLAANPYTYVPATLIYDGRAYGPIGMRLKGQNSFLPISQKPSLRLNIDYYVPKARIFGLDDMTLNNMSGDASMLHERLAYQVARAAGIPASRVNHALVAINGEPYGLYAHVETVKKELLSRWFADPTGALFEATDVDFASGYLAAYELESGPDDRSLLAGLAAALTITNPDQAIAMASSYVDLAQFQRFWAVCSVIGQFDSFPYSMPGDDYFVYADPTSGRLVFLPWGMDETFLSGAYDVTQVSSVMAQKCRASSACFQGYMAQVWDVLAMTEAAGLDLERQRVASQIATQVAQDTHRPYDAQTVADSQADVGWFIKGRRQNLTDMLTTTP